MKELIRIPERRGLSSKGKGGKVLSSANGGVRNQRCSVVVDTYLLVAEKSWACRRGEGNGVASARFMIQKQRRLFVLTGGRKKRTGRERRRGQGRIGVRRMIGRKRSDFQLDSRLKKGPQLAGLIRDAGYRKVGLKSTAALW